MTQSATDHSNEHNPYVGATEIAQMTQEFFDSTLSLPIEAIADSAQVEDDWFQATIRISGGWNANLTVLTDNRLAKEIAGAMFCMGAEELQEEEIVDALGEVVNVIGGNIKGIANLDCNLSLPCVGKAIAEAEGGIPGLPLAVTFNSDEQRMKVALYCD